MEDRKYALLLQNVHWGRVLHSDGSMRWQTARVLLRLRERSRS